MNEPDVIVVGAGLAGLVATHELAQAGRRVLVLDQENRNNLGGQAFWSLGGLFLVDSPEQRRMGIKDSLELALQDWLGSASSTASARTTGRGSGREAYVEFAAGEKRQYLHDLGLRVTPFVGWAERGGRRAPTGTATPCRASISPGAPARRSCGSSLEPVLEAEQRGLVDVRVPAPGRRADRRGRRGRRRPRHRARADADLDRGATSSRDRGGRVRTPRTAVIVTSGGIGAQPRPDPQELADRTPRPAPEDDHLRRARARRRAHARDHRGRRRHHRQPRPDVALHRGHQQLGPDLARPRDPDHPRPVLAVVRRERRASARTVLPRLRHATARCGQILPPATTTRGSCSPSRSSRRSSRCRAPSRTPTSPARTSSSPSRAGSPRARRARCEAFKRARRRLRRRRHPARPGRRHERDRPRPAARPRPTSSARSSPATASSTTSTARTSS